MKLFLSLQQAVTDESAKKTLSIFKLENNVSVLTTIYRTTSVIGFIGTIIGIIL